MCIGPSQGLTWDPCPLVFHLGSSSVARAGVMSCRLQVNANHSPRRCSDRGSQNKCQMALRNIGYDPMNPKPHAMLVGFSCGPFRRSNSVASGSGALGDGVRRICAYFPHVSSITF